MDAVLEASGDAETEEEAIKAAMEAALETVGAGMQAAEDAET